MLSGAKFNEDNCQNLTGALNVVHVRPVFWLFPIGSKVWEKADLIILNLGGILAGGEKAPRPHLRLSPRPHLPPRLHYSHALPLLHSQDILQTKQPQPHLQESPPGGLHLPADLLSAGRLLEPQQVLAVNLQERLSVTFFVIKFR